MYNFSSPNLCSLAVNISRIYEIAKYGNHSVKIVPSETCSIQDIDLLTVYYGFINNDNPDIIVELCYSPDDVMNVFRTGNVNETLEQINERLPKNKTEVSEALDSVSLNFLKTAIGKCNLGVNDVIKIHRISQTIAGLSASKTIKVEHVAEAVLYRTIKL